MSANFGIVPDFNVSKNCSACSDQHAITQGRMAFFTNMGDASQSDSVIDHTIITDLRGLSNDNPHPVIDDETSSDPSTRMDLDARDPPTELRDSPRHKRYAPAMQQMGDSMHSKRFDSRVQQKDFKAVSGRRIVFHVGLNE